METKPTDRQLIDLIRKRLLEASSGDRKYERPMNWAEADHLMEILARTERNRDMWKGQCERQAVQLTKLHAKSDPLTALRYSARRLRDQLTPNRA